MFVRIFTLEEGTGIMFTREGRMLPMIGETDVSAREIRFGQFNTQDIQEFNRRVASGETVWIENEFTKEILNGAEMSFIRNHSRIGQVLSLHLLAEAYGATTREMAMAIMENEDADLEAADGIVSFDAPPSIVAQSSCLVFSRTLHEGSLVNLPGLCSSAFAWMIEERTAGVFHYLQILGYPEDMARHMDPAFTPMAPTYGATYANACNNAKSFVDHVQIAMQCALDTPQVVTVRVGGGDGGTRLVVKNRRVSSLIHGLEVALPTGGVVFVRNAYLRDGTLMQDNAFFPKRALTIRIIKRMGEDLLWGTHVARLGVSMSPIVASALGTYVAPNPSAFVGSGPAHG